MTLPMWIGLRVKIRGDEAEEAEEEEIAEDGGGVDAVVGFGGGCMSCLMPLKCAVCEEYALHGQATGSIFCQAGR